MKLEAILQRLGEIEDHMEAAKRLESPPTGWHDTAWLCRVVRELLTRSGRLEAVAEAAREALRWFQEFGYNRWGIAVQDDFPDHEPILWSLKASLASLEEVLDG